MWGFRYKSSIIHLFIVLDFIYLHLVQYWFIVYYYALWLAIDVNLHWEPVIHLHFNVFLVVTWIPHFVGSIIAIMYHTKISYYFLYPCFLSTICETRLRIVILVIMRAPTIIANLQLYWQLLPILFTYLLKDFIFRNLFHKLNLFIKQLFVAINLSKFRTISSTLPFS